VSRDQPAKAPRYYEPRPTQTTNVAPRQLSDVNGDVIVHATPLSESKPSPKQVDVASAVPRQRQNLTATTSTDQPRCESERGRFDTAAVSQDQTGATKRTKTKSELQSNSFRERDDAATRKTTQSPLKLDYVQTASVEKPAPAKTKPKATSADMAVPESESTPGRRIETEVKAIQSKPVSISKPSSSQCQQPDPVKHKEAAPPVQSSPSATNRVKAEMFSAGVKVEPVKASPVKVKCKPRRQTRATLAYDRVMFFSDFFRRLESDRRLFALPPVRRNRVYVRPRAEDASPAPVKFPKPPPTSTTKKGRIGVVGAARNPSGRPSPFSVKRRQFPNQVWDHKIDLESIATLIGSRINGKPNR